MGNRACLSIGDISNNRTMLKKNRHLVPKDSPGERSVTEWSVPETSELAQRNAIFFLPPCHYSKRRKSIAIWMAYKDPSL